MAQSLVSSSGSTINHWCSQGLGNAVPSLLQEAPQLLAALLPANAPVLNVQTYQSGTSYLLRNPPADGVVNLPIVTTAAGCKWKFLITEPLANNWVITPTTSVIDGSLVIGPSAGPQLVPGTASASITLVGAATGARAGDWVTLECDGTNYYCAGQGAAAACMTIP